MTSELADIQTKLQDTNEAIARLERMMVDSPDLPSLLANMRSLQKRHKKLEADLVAASARDIQALEDAEGGEKW